MVDIEHCHGWEETTKKSFPRVSVAFLSTSRHGNDK